MASIGAAGLAFIVFGPRVGWWPTVVFLVVGVVLFALDRHIARTARAEWAIAAAYVVGGIACGVVVATTGGHASPLLAVFGIPMFLLANRFRRPVTLVGLTLAVGILLVSTVGRDPAAVADDPSSVVLTAMLLVGITVLTLPLYDQQVHLRERGHLDPLTGLLNRSSLETRFSDAVARATPDRQPVSLVLIDLDAFKRVNDTHGHVVGDAVLRDAAQIVASNLRDSESVYRLGGEEIGIVLPGLDARQAVAIAERQRRALEGARPGGVPLTMSAGIACGYGADADWARLYRQADGALLRAKAEGRNRVCVATPDDREPFGDPPPFPPGDPVKRPT